MKTQKMIYAALLFAGLFFLASCQPVDFDGPQLAANSATTVQTYHVSIPAVFDNGAQTKGVVFDGDSDISHFFTGTEEEGVHVVIPGAKAIAGTIENGKLVPTALTPTNITQDGQHCELTGALTFFKKAGNGYTTYNPDANDSFNLYYQTPRDDTYRFGDALVGFAKATGVTMNINGNTMSVDGSVNFENVGSMFRQNLSFKIGGRDTVPAIKRFVISTDNRSTIAKYNPLGEEGYRYGQYFNDKYTFDEIEITDNNNVLDEGNIFFSLMFLEDVNQSDALILTAFDNNGNRYTCTKDAPAGGFENGKYYYGEATLSAPDKPTITFATVGGGEPVVIDPYDPYERFMGDEIELGRSQTVTFSGKSEEFSFYVCPYSAWSGIVLDNLHATCEGSFIDAYCQSPSNITLRGSNFITSNDDAAIDNYLKPVLLSCDGASATLTVTVPEKKGGLHGSNYDCTAGPTDYDLSRLAAPGFSVSLENADPAPVNGMYTYVYTVTKQSTINISNLSYDCRVEDGQTLTGTLTNAATCDVAIAPGATVTLSGITIQKSTNDSGVSGITCLGDATLILADGTTNTVNGRKNNRPGIYVPEGQKLIIKGGDQGTGVLNVISGGDAAGIGGGYYESSCGSVEIQGGVINATGDGRAAGIGCCAAYYWYDTNSCGDITITGGTVTATGGQYGYGIGSGEDANGGESSCGKITIGASVNSVTAIRGDMFNRWNCIGVDYAGTCGVVKFGDVTVYTGTEWTPVPFVAGNYGGLTLAISKTSVDNDTWTLTPTPPQP